MDGVIIKAEIDHDTNTRILGVAISATIVREFKVEMKRRIKAEEDLRQIRCTDQRLAMREQRCRMRRKLK